HPRLYLGVAAQGRSMKVVMLRTYLALLAAAQKSYDADGGRKNPENAADAYMTLLGYFNSLRELGGARRIVEDEVNLRLTGYANRKRLGQKEGPFASRSIAYEVVELTSRVHTGLVAEAKRRLALLFHEKDRVDVAIATNMISVGLDIMRLGLMVVLGQPKMCAEYIQATSRVGRDPEKPGLIVTLLNIHRPRVRADDAAHGSSGDPPAPAGSGIRRPGPCRSGKLECFARGGRCTGPVRESPRQGQQAARYLEQDRRRLSQPGHHFAVQPKGSRSGQAPAPRVPGSRAQADELTAQVFSSQSVHARRGAERESLGANHGQCRGRAGGRVMSSSKDKKKKPHGQIRQSQVVMTFGPGSMFDLPNHAVIIGGLEYWTKGDEVHEPRLLAKLKDLLKLSSLVLHAPPPADDDPESTRKTGIDSIQFPEWFITQSGQGQETGSQTRSRRLVHRTSLTGKSKFIDE